MLSWQTSTTFSLSVDPALARFSSALAAAPRSSRRCTSTRKDDEALSEDGDSRISVARVSPPHRDPLGHSEPLCLTLLLVPPPYLSWQPRFHTRCMPKQVKEDTVDLRPLFGGGIQQREAKKTQAPAPTAPEAINPGLKPKRRSSLEQLIRHICGAAGLAQFAASTAVNPSASTSPAPSPSTPPAPPAKAAAPDPTPVAPAGMDSILKRFLGRAAAAQPSASSQSDIQQLISMLLAAREERELAEAIR
ncbi:hypothetical protein DFH06DRAFT_1347015 [Mycena polygramma]|nr:hypothetical protein DFH06DRAFT_1347015 [Mycena polygramma]